MSLEVILYAVLLLVGALGVYLYFRRRATSDGEVNAQRERDNLDTVAAWPPEVTRLMTGGERVAHETLVKALPECMIFSQVPLARFIRVPRRNSYADWLTRVGHLSADFLICDRASLVIGAVSLQSTQETEGAARRRARMTRVMKSAGVKVFVWREQAIPTAESARDQITQRVTVSEAAPSPTSDAAARAERPATRGTVKIPIPDVLAETPMNGPRLDPPSTTWFDDLDSGSTPLDAPRKRPGA